MKCPACRSALVTCEFQGVEVDVCPSCQGIWLDSGELEVLLKDAGTRDQLLRSFQPETASKESRRPCPVCDRKMAKVNVGLTERVLVDRCDQGHGLWFDRQELPRILSQGRWDEKNQVPAYFRELFLQTEGSSEREGGTE